MLRLAVPVILSFLGIRETLAACQIAASFCAQMKPACGVYSSFGVQDLKCGLINKDPCLIIKENCVDGGRKEPSTKCMDLNLSKLRQQLLRELNAERAKHGSPPLTRDATIESVAQAFAEKKAKNGGKPDHNAATHGVYGENAYNGYAFESFKGGDAAKLWYKEIANYDFTTHKTNGKGEIGHFTQNVWKSSTKFGAGFAKGEECKLYVIGNFAPPGNYEGEYAENVPPLTG